MGYTLVSTAYRLALYILLIGLLAGCGSQASLQPVTPAYWPTEGWRSDSPENHGLDGAALSEAAARAGEELPFLDGLLIIRHGYLVHSSYYNGYDSATRHDIASMTKSWTSAAVGVAHGQGALPDLDSTLPALLPDYFAGEALGDKREITLRHLLTMRSGIEFDDELLTTGGYGGDELLAGDLTATALSFPMAFRPGETWNYSTLDTQLISAIVQEAVGEPLEAYAAARLFTPLGITDYTWLADARGTTVGGQNLSMAPADMAKLGLLYLHNGVWDGEQLVPAEWVELSLTSQGDEAFFVPTGKQETIEWYGYHWWTWKPEWFYGYRSFQAQGFGGQQVLVFPELDLIIVTTANMPDGDLAVADQQEKALRELILKSIFPALTDVSLKER